MRGCSEIRGQVVACRPSLLLLSMQAGLSGATWLVSPASRDLVVDEVAAGKPSPGARDHRRELAEGAFGVERHVGGADVWGVVSDPQAEAVEVE